MDKIEILASDLDGTLFDSQGRLSEKNLRAIEELDRLGIWFVPTTGRTLGEISPLLVNNPCIRYLIHSNGAVIYDKQTGKRVLNCLPRKTLDKIFSLVGNDEVHVTVRYSGVTYCDARKNSQEAYAYYNVCSAHSEILKMVAVEKQDFDRWHAGLDHVEVISLFFKSEDSYKACRERLKTLEDVRAVNAAPYNLEIFSKTAGKGVALSHLADMLGVRLQNTAAVGDSGNDLHALQTAGIGFAVANASAELKAVADELICSCDEDAIDYILHHFVKEK